MQEAQIGWHQEAAVRPIVSIITVFHNRAEHVEASIASLLAQRGVDYEIVALDDGSTDDTLACLQAISNPRLTVVAQANTGFTAAINTAIAHSRGRYIAIHGAGDISLPNRIARQAAILEARPEVGVIGCHVSNDAKLGSDRYVIRPPDGLPFFETLLGRNLFTHGEVMFRRDLFDRVGGYRTMFTYAQDRDLWLRMSRYTSYAIVPEVLYERRRFADGVSSKPDKLLLQAYASNFAVQLARRGVGEDGRDQLDRLGPLATMLRQRSPTLARTVAWTGARLMVLGDLPVGWSLVTTARREAMTRQVLAIWLLCAAHRLPILWRPIRKLLQRRLLAFDRAAQVTTPSNQSCFSAP